jgi:hypothetical protein
MSGKKVLKESIDRDKFAGKPCFGAGEKILEFGGDGGGSSSKFFGRCRSAKSDARGHARADKGHDLTGCRRAFKSSGDNGLVWVSGFHGNAGN